jgi:hypothetical protein
MKTKGKKGERGAAGGWASLGLAAGWPRRGAGGPWPARPNSALFGPWLQSFFSYLTILKTSLVLGL